VTRLVTEDNPNDNITNSGLDMAAGMLTFIVREANITLRWRHMGVCSNSAATVTWHKDKCTGCKVDHLTHWKIPREWMDAEASTLQQGVAKLHKKEAATNEGGKSD
jgi:hypothetical protein